MLQTGEVTLGWYDRAFVGFGAPLEAQIVFQQFQSVEEHALSSKQTVQGLMFALHHLLHAEKHLLKIQLTRTLRQTKRRPTQLHQRILRLPLTLRPVLLSQKEFSVFSSIL